MKKCPECHKELDKYGIACQYCAKVEESRDKDNKQAQDAKNKSNNNPA